MNERLALSVTALLVALAACSSTPAEGQGADATPAPPPPASVGSAVPSPTEATPSSPAPQRDPLPRPERADFETEHAPGALGDWSVERAGDTYVIVAEESVVGLGPRGQELWTLEVPKRRTNDLIASASNEITAAVADGVVVVSHPISGQEWPGLHRVLVLDPDTGSEIWRDDTASIVSTWDDVVYTTTCLGQQTNTPGDCTISARDPHSGATRWSRPSYHHAEIAAIEDDYLVLRSYPKDGSHPLIEAISPDSGETLGGGAGPTAVAVDRVFLQTGADDPSTKGGCSQLVRGIALDGSELWERSIRLGKDANDKGECATLYTYRGDGGLATLTWYEGVPQVIEVDTGRTVWRGRKADETALVTRSLIVAVHAPGGWVDGARGIDPRTGRVLWTDPRSTSSVWRAEGDILIDSVDDYCDTCATTTRHPRTGELIARYRGALAGVGPDWLATVRDPSAPRLRYAVFLR